MTTQDKNRKLIERFPFLLPHNRWTDEVPEDYDYSYTELDAMPHGWRIAFGEELCEEIREELVQADYLDKYRIAEIKEKLRLLNGSSMKLYNANTATLLESLRLGCAGYSGVMANFHCESYVWLCKNFWKEEAEDVADLLTVSAMIENCNYPKNAKYGLNEIEKIPMSTYTRVGGNLTLTEEAIRDVRSVDKLIKHFPKERM